MYAVCRHLCSAAFLSFFVIPGIASGQDTGAQDTGAAVSGSAAVSLDTILDSAETNIEAYRKGVPNVYCTEHAVAKRRNANSAMGEEIAVPGGSMPIEKSATVEVSVETTSIFRLRRLEKPTERGMFEESRILQQITKSADAPGYEDVAVPELLYGVFSNGLNILSREGRACFQFKLKQSHPGKPYLVQFADLPLDRRAPGCPEAESGKGAIEIDPTTMHVTSIERTLPHHLLLGDVMGSWTWKEKFAPVVLKQGTFWLPSSIDSRSVSEDRKSLWTFSATYKDYHQFYSSTRILQAPKP